MANEQNEAVVRRTFDAFNTGDTSAAEEIIGSDAVAHDPAQPEEARGPEGFKQTIELYRGAFSDLEFTLDEIFSDRDLVCTRWSTEATHDGDLMGISATGNRITGSGISIDRVVDGKVAESWVQWDNMGLLQQIGAFETAGAAAG
jgi:predicted ester cyclase